MEENTDQPNSNVNFSNISVTPPVSSPINPPAGKPKSKLPILIIGIILFLLLAGSAAGFYAFKPQIMNLVSKPTPTPNIPLKQPHKNLNPNTGNLYEDMKVRLKEELK